MSTKKSNQKYLNFYESYIHKSRYAKYIPELKRREHLEETVTRYMDYMRKHIEKDHGYTMTDKEYEMLFEGILNFESMPSMRAMMTAGKALDRDSTCSYNCSYLIVDDIKAFDETMYILMNGTGVGFSVERQYINQLPEIPDVLYDSDTTIVVKDSKEGWSKSFRQLIALLYTGEVPKWDLSKLRPAGAPLKTFGGRCLTGDTIVYKDRKRSRGYNEITIKELFDIKTRESNEKYRSRFKKIKLRSVDEKTGEFFRNHLVDVHSNGVQDVYQVVTENGYRIKSTANHRFMGNAGDWQELSEFDVGDLIAVNGSSELKTGTCMDCETPISRRAIRCKPCFDISQQKDDCLPTTARSRKAVKDYRNKFEHCELCGTTEQESMLEIHHRDGIPQNNNEENLLCVCVPCHRKEDMKRIYFGDAYSCKYMMYDKIIKIEYVGQEETYDLEMEGPNHNFIANGFISHNSSGPGPLDDLFKFTVNIFRHATGRKLTSLECHDIMCKIGETIVVGGVRRSAMISLSNLSDDRMRSAKAGAWWEKNPQRTLSNNSAVYTEKPEVGAFMHEWTSIYESKSGERGIFNREASQKQAAKFGRRDKSTDYGTNPCSEIILRPFQMCNLSEVIARSTDTMKDLERKIVLASILGTIQSTLTNFPYLRKIWKKNTEEERLLGVSLTGIYDCPLLNDYTDPELPARLMHLRDLAKKTNEEWAAKLNIPASASITCVKPSGTVSQLVDSASGIHPRHSKYYYRRVRSDNKDPITEFMSDQGIPSEPDIMKPIATTVFTFAKSAPKGALTREDISAIDHLSLWLIYQEYWCEHKPSITVSIKEEEWPKVGAWVWDHFDELSGVSFLPYDGGIYKQAPYEAIDEKSYEDMIINEPTEVDWNNLIEDIDNVEGTQVLACTANSCEL